MKTFNELCGLGWNKNKMIAFCRGGSRDSSSGSDSSSSSSNNSSSDSGGGFLGTNYDSFSDMFDGGGPGMSGSSFSTQDNRDLDTDGDGNITDSEALAGTGSINLAGGLDGSNTSEADLINSDLSDDEFWEEFENNTSSMNTDTGVITTVGSSGNNNNNSGGNPVGGNENQTPSNFYNNDSGFDNNVTSALTGVATNVSQPGGGSSTNTGEETNTTNTGEETNTTNTGEETNTTNTGEETSTTNTGENTNTGDNSLIDDLNSQIADLQNQLNNMNNSGGGNTIVYEGAGDTNTSLPDDYLTEADLARYLDNLDLGSNAYDPAAFLNAYGFALDPSMMGNLIPTMQSNNGLFVRRAVKDKDTGEIRYVNVPIGPGATGGNAGLSQFQMERRAGFGNLL